MQSSFAWVFPASLLPFIAVVFKGQLTPILTYHLYVPQFHCIMLVTVLELKVALYEIN